MKRCRIFVFFILLLAWNPVHSIHSSINNKKAFIITGQESSGSVFISRVIAFALGVDSRYGGWSGYGYCGKLGDDIIVHHRSQPSDRPPQFFSLNDFQTLFEGYELYFIITTRDINIIQKSKKKRFGYDFNSSSKHRQIAKKILKDIMEHEKFLIWNYETMIFLGYPYFKQLYDFLGVNSTFITPDIVD